MSHPLAERFKAKAPREELIELRDAAQFTTGQAVRDEHGRLAKGSTFQPSLALRSSQSALKRAQRELLELLADKIMDDPAVLDGMFGAIITKLQAGDLGMTELVLNYLLGKPVQRSLVASESTSDIRITIERLHDQTTITASGTAAHPSDS